MPIYEYRCSACGHELETLQKLSDPPLTRCPACGTDELSKKVSAAAFRLKGGGWYETDFKSGDKRNLAGDAAKGEGAAKAADGGDKAKPVAESKAPAATPAAKATAKE